MCIQEFPFSEFLEAPHMLSVNVAFQERKSTFSLNLNDENFRSSENNSNPKIFLKISKS